MSERRLCGYDLNGWSDRVARNWQVQPDGEVTVGETRLTHAIRRPFVVRLGDGRTERWVGGAQAALAPHGLGTGWGDVGQPDRRRAVALVLADDAAPDAQLAAALSGLAQGARVCAVALDDHPVSTERRQERILSAMGRAKVGRGLLVWRSVLALLGCLAEPSASLQPCDGQKIGVITHVGDGFSLQVLRLRRERGQDETFFAPERRRAADIFLSPLGYDGLAESSVTQLAAASPSLRLDEVRQLRAIADLTLAGASRAELWRKTNADFQEIPQQQELDLPATPFPQNAFAALEDCPVVLFETLATGLRRDALAALFRAGLGARLQILPEGIVALGALEAARRFAVGAPVYFDFLPQISTIVQGRDGAVNCDLIGQDETLPAGHIYRSRNPARFAVQSGQADITVYLHKELDPRPRKARVDLGQAVLRQLEVALSVEQSPAAGRARLMVDAPGIARQFTIDWDAASQDPRSWAEILKDLEHPPATIPKRLVLRGGIDAWAESKRGPDLGALLLASDQQGGVEPDWKSLATRMGARRDGQYCISSDGELPEEIPPALRQTLDRLTEKAMDQLRRRIAGRLTADNEALKFVTWQFRYAPDETAGILLGLLEARSPGFRHPFVAHAASWTLVCQGFARICKDDEQERRAIASIALRPIKDWNFRQETAAAAMLLSRSDTAPLHLTREVVERFGDRVLIEFAGEIGSQYTKFTYAPFLLAGLLRWRMKEPNALVVGLDPLADKLRDAVDRALTDFHRRGSRSVNFDRRVMRYRTILQQLLEELAGRGSNPDILMDIYNSASSADQDDAVASGDGG